MEFSRNDKNILMIFETLSQNLFEMLRLKMLKQQKQKKCSSWEFEILLYIFFFVNSGLQFIHELHESFQTLKSLGTYQE